MARMPAFLDSLAASGAVQGAGGLVHPKKDEVHAKISREDFRDAFADGLPEQETDLDRLIADLEEFISRSLAGEAELVPEGKIFKADVSEFGVGMYKADLGSFVKCVGLPIVSSERRAPSDPAQLDPIPETTDVPVRSCSYYLGLRVLNQVFRTAHTSIKQGVASSSVCGRVYSAVSGAFAYLGSALSGLRSCFRARALQQDAPVVGAFHDLVKDSVVKRHDARHEDTARHYPRCKW